MQKNPCPFTYLFKIKKKINLKLFIENNFSFEHLDL